MAQADACGIVLVGCGTVGGATAAILTRQADHLTQRVGRPLTLRAIVDVDFTRARAIGLDESLFCEDPDGAIARDDVEVVVELVGGTGFARDVVAKALSAGKSVVTANKALLAHHGPELWALARQHGACIAFEGSCGGAIPIVAALTGELAADRVEALYGIVNGTCNYILTAMTANGRTYADALTDAQAKGLAEADPTLDVSGGDSAHKLAILAALAFGQRVDFGRIYVEGIDRLDLTDIRYGRELGYVVKLLAIARQQEDGLSLRVHPAFISLKHPLAWVSGPFNAISVYADNSGHTMHYGRGAGGSPTAAAVVGDIASVALGNARRSFDQLGIWPDRSAPAVPLDMDRVRCRYYLRLTVLDRPGVLGTIANVLGERGISISSVLQHEPAGGGDGDGVHVILTTSGALEGNLHAALNVINNHPTVKAPTVCIRMIDEHPERIE
ncbi:MAG TPA: homoserine dehydrogenase [Phycisphaerae bacterium]|nr:homoserine dehydrogenase [Phycisphaerae bacterium]HUU21458.1 homoserine dehydrogenase [Phycisphaerae bacterium]